MLCCIYLWSVMGPWPLLVRHWNASPPWTTLNKASLRSRALAFWNQTWITRGGKLSSRLKRLISSRFGRGCCAKYFFRICGKEFSFHSNFVSLRKSLNPKTYGCFIFRYRRSGPFWRLDHSADRKSGVQVANSKIVIGWIVVVALARNAVLVECHHQTRVISTVAAGFWSITGRRGRLFC